MNKKRPRENGAEAGEPGDNLCRPLLTTGSCQFGDDRCRFSHDIVAYLKRKEKVLCVCVCVRGAFHVYVVFFFFFFKFYKCRWGLPPHPTAFKDQNTQALTSLCASHSTQQIHFFELKTKKKDLGPTCPTFEKYGHCPSGVTCRFGRAHIDVEKGACVCCIKSKKQARRAQ